MTLLIDALQEKVKQREWQTVTTATSVLSKEVKSSELNLEGRLNKTNMRELKLTLHGKHDLQGKTIQFERSFMTLGKETFTIPYGSFIVLETDYNDNGDTTDILAHDFMLKTHKIYKKEDVNLTVPFTIWELFTEVLRVTELTTDLLSFPLSSQIITEDKYANLEYTYRDVLDHIAEVAGMTMGIVDDKVSMWKPQETGITIDYKRSKSLKVGGKVGTFNILNLTREPQHDNHPYPPTWTDIPLSLRSEYNVTNNQIIDKDREHYAPLIFDEIKDLEYTTFEASTYGWGIFKVGDIVTIKDLGGGTYKSIITSELNSMTGMWLSELKSEKIENAQEDYVIATDERRLGQQTYILVDKQNQKIDLHTSYISGIDGTRSDAGISIKAIEGVDIYGKNFRILDQDKLRTIFEVGTDMTDPSNPKDVVNITGSIQSEGGEIQFDSENKKIIIGNVTLRNDIYGTNSLEIMGNLSARGNLSVEFVEVFGGIRAEGNVELTDGNISTTGNLNVHFIEAFGGIYADGAIELTGDVTTGSIKNLGHYYGKTATFEEDVKMAKSLITDNIRTNKTATNKRIGLAATSERFDTIYLINQPDVQSDSRVKDFIQDIPQPLIDELVNIKPKMFKLKDKEKWTFGYVAQDVQEVMERYGKGQEFSVINSDDEMLSLLYGELSVLKDAQHTRKINELEERLLKLEEKIWNNF